MVRDIRWFFSEFYQYYNYVLRHPTSLVALFISLAQLTSPGPSLINGMDTDDLVGLALDKDHSALPYL